MARKAKEKREKEGIVDQLVNQEFDRAKNSINQNYRTNRDQIREELQKLCDEEELIR